MINLLVDSALENGCLSVASESLLRQLVNMKVYNASDLEALVNLKKAFKSGQITREFCSQKNSLDLWDNLELMIY